MGEKPLEADVQRMIITWGEDPIVYSLPNSWGGSFYDYSRDRKLLRRKAGSGQYVYTQPDLSDCVEYTNIQAAIYAVYGFEGEIVERELRQNVLDAMQEIRA